MNCGGIFDLEAQKKELKNLEEKGQDPSLWKDHQKMNHIARQKAEIEKTIKHWESLNTQIEENQLLLEMAEEDPGKETFLELETHFSKFKEALSQLELKSFLNEPYDKSNCYVTIHAGAGGAEAADWAGMLQRMYFKWAEQKKLNTEIIFLNESETAGLKSTGFLVKGLFAYGWLKAETGVHRLVRISPFDSGRRRHTSFAGVFAWPEVDDTINILIKEEDLKIDTYKAGGAGGQHVNKTNSAVRITHLPTGAVVQCQNQRSQHANKNQAMKMLKAVLVSKEKEKQKKEKEARSADKKANEWGSQIRSYILHPYQMVKDHRTGLEMPQPQDVLDGLLDPFISAWLKSKER